MCGYQQHNRHPTRVGFKPAPTAIHLLALLILLTACSGAPTATAIPPTPPPSPTTAVPAPSATSPAATPTTARATGTTPAPPLAPASATPGVASCAPGVDFLGFADNLDKTQFSHTDVGGLSALAYDAARGVYYALTDNQGDTPARFYTLRLPLDGGKLGTPIVEAVTILRDESGQPFTGRDLDGEGLALWAGGQVLVASESEPSIRRFGLDGQLIDELRVPDRFLVKPRGEGTENQTFESLVLSPDGLSLFTAVEGPLAADGFTGELRARNRILRYTSRPPFLPSGQYFFLAEPLQGVSDLVAVSNDELLVLERGFIPGLGNTIRIFRVSLTGATDISDRPTLTDPTLTPLKKELLVDLANCPASGATHPARQANPLLDNFEALTLGPTLPDGRRTLLLLSDDNFGRDQVTRVIALALR